MRDITIASRPREDGGRTLLWLCLVAGFVAQPVAIALALGGTVAGTVGLALVVAWPWVVAACQPGDWRLGGAITLGVLAVGGAVVPAGQPAVAWVVATALQYVTAGVLVIAAVVRSVRSRTPYGEGVEDLAAMVEERQRG